MVPHSILLKKKTQPTKTPLLRLTKQTIQSFDVRNGHVVQDGQRIEIILGAHYMMSGGCTAAAIVLAAIVLDAPDLVVLR